MPEGGGPAPAPAEPATPNNHCRPYQIGTLWERYEGVWSSNAAVDSPGLPPAGKWGYRWKMPGTVFGATRQQDDSLGTRDGLIDDACYRATGEIVAVRETRSDGTTVEWGDPAHGDYALSYCDRECGVLPEPFPTGLFNRMVD